MLLLLLGGIGWLYKHEKEKRLEIEKKLSEKKYAVYSNLTDIFFEILKQINKNQKTQIDKVADKMIDIKKEILIYGSDKVIQKFFNWQRNTETNQSLKAFAELMIEIRKDMGNPNTRITPLDFLISLLKNANEIEELKKQGFVFE